MIRTYEIDLDDKLVDEAGKIFDSLGSDIDSAIKIFLTQAVLRKGFPFEVAVPKNEEEEIKSENLVEENALESISENQAETQNEPELSQDDFDEKQPEKESEIPDSVKIAELKKDLSELSENPEKIENDENASSSESESNSNSEDEDETAPENLFEQWKSQNS